MSKNIKKETYRIDLKLNYNSPKAIDEELKALGHKRVTFFKKIVRSVLNNDPRIKEILDDTENYNEITIEEL